MTSHKKEDYIDLTKLSQRELLLLMRQEIQGIKEDVHQVQAAEQKIMLKVNTLEVKSRVWGSVGGFISGIAAIIGERLLLK